MHKCNVKVLLASVLWLIMKPKWIQHHPVLFKGFFNVQKASINNLTMKHQGGFILLQLLGPKGEHWRGKMGSILWGWNRPRMAIEENFQWGQSWKSTKINLTQNGNFRSLQMQWLIEEEWQPQAYHQVMAQGKLFCCFCHLHWVLCWQPHLHQHMLPGHWTCEKCKLPAQENLVHGQEESQSPTRLDHQIVILQQFGHCNASLQASAAWQNHRLLN